MKLDYFNIIKEGKKVNINNINFSTLLNESLLDVRQKNASNLSDEEFKDYCDHIYSAVAYQDLISKRIRRGDSPDKENLIMPIDNEFNLPFGKC